MVLPASNDEALMLMIGADIQKIIDQLADWILGQITMSLLDNVYSFPEGRMYQRLEMDGGVLGSFTKEISDFAVNYVEAKVFSDPSRMIYDGGMHEHGNSNTDRREEVLEDIEKGINYDFGSNASEMRPFWQPILDLVDSGELNSVFEAMMSQSGINFIRG